MDEKFFGVEILNIATIMGDPDNPKSLSEYVDLVTSYLRGCEDSETVASYRLAHITEDKKEVDPLRLLRDMREKNHYINDKNTIFAGIVFPSEEAYRKISSGLENEFSFELLEALDDPIE